MPKDMTLAQVFHCCLQHEWCSWRSIFNWSFVWPSAGPIWILFNLTSCVNQENALKFSQLIWYSIIILFTIFIAVNIVYDRTCGLMHIYFHYRPGWRLLGSTLARRSLKCWTPSTKLRGSIWRLGGNECFQSVPSWFETIKKTIHTIFSIQIDSITRWTKRSPLDHRSTGEPMAGFPMREALKTYQPVSLKLIFDVLSWHIMTTVFSIHNNSWFQFNI